MKDKYNFSAVESNLDIMSSSYLPRRTDIGLDTTVQITPYANMSYEESYESMKKFFENEWVSDEQSGFEIIYDSDENQTKMNLLIDSFVNSEGQTLDNFTKENQADVGNSEVSIFKQLDEDSYVSGARVYFEKDYWNPIINSPNQITEDPLDNIISSMSRSEVTTGIQITSTPIEDSKLNKRYPLGHMVYRIFVGYISVIFSFFYPILLFLIGKANKKNIILDPVNQIFEEIVSTLTYLKGYEKIDYKREFNYIADYNTKDIQDKKQEIKGETNPIETLLMLPILPNIEANKSTDRDTLRNQLNEAIDRVDEKSERHGHVVEIRIFAIGDDKEKVENQMNGLSKTIDELYSTPNADKSVQQSLAVHPVNGRSDMKQFIMDLGQRKTGVDIYDRVRNHYSIKWLHKNRSRPLVMTPAEIASVVHMPSKDVKDRSVEYDSPTPEGNIPEEYE